MVKRVFDKFDHTIDSYRGPSIPSPEFVIQAEKERRKDYIATSDIRSWFSIDSGKFFCSTQKDRDIVYFDLSECKTKEEVEAFLEKIRK